MLFSGFITGKLMAGRSSGRDKMYADATNTAVEGLAAVRTITAFK